MRALLFGATIFMAAGLAYSGSSIHAETAKDTSISGKVTAIYGSDIIALEGYNGYIVLSGFADATADMPAGERQEMLQEMIGDGAVTCQQQSFDEYGHMVASCVNMDGEALTGQGAAETVAGL